VLAFYPQIKAVHMAAVLASGALFLLRGLLVQTGRENWAMWGPVRYVSYGIDTVLLTAALMLVAVVPAALFANHWLSLKLALLVVYIIVGSVALKEPRAALRSSGLLRARERPFTFRRTQSTSARRAYFVAALVIYVTMLGIARAHHPLGWMHVLAGSLQSG
jgi:uncharacterized membrane protein SirB2